MTEAEWRVGAALMTYRQRLVGSSDISAFVLNRTLKRVDQHIGRWAIRNLEHILTATQPACAACGSAGGRMLYAGPGEPLVVTCAQCGNSGTGPTQ